jgi:hypothetical protein
MAGLAICAGKGRRFSGNAGGAGMTSRCVRGCRHTRGQICRPRISAGRKNRHEHSGENEDAHDTEITFSHYLLSFFTWNEFFDYDIITTTCFLIAEN